MRSDPETEVAEPRPDAITVAAELAQALEIDGLSGLRAWWLGRVPYARALALQEAIVREHARTGDLLLLLEHEPVYTTGRGGRAENLGSVPTAVPLFRVNRGGDATFHGPGQLVGYPLLDLRARGGDVHRYLRAIEAALLDLLDDLGIVAGTCAGRTGVWVGDTQEPRKIASIGVGVRRGVTMHGFALNLTLDLAPFAHIVPCGLAGVEMTSVAAELRRHVRRRSRSLSASIASPAAAEHSLEQLAPPSLPSVATLAARRLAERLAVPRAIADTSLEVSR